MPLDIPQQVPPVIPVQGATKNNQAPGATETKFEPRVASATHAEHEFEDVSLVSAFRRPLPGEKPGMQRGGAARLSDQRSLRQFYRQDRLRGLQGGLGEQLFDEDIGPLAGRLLAAAQHEDHAGLLDHEGSAGDPFKHYVALLEAREQASSLHGADKVADRLDAALSRLWNARRNEILVGFNTAKPFAAFATKVAEWDAFRRIYYDCVVTGHTMAACFKSLLGEFGPDRMESAIQSLRNAIAADLAAMATSADRIRMIQQHSDLEQNRVIAALMAESRALIRLHSGAEPLAQGVMDLLGHLLDYAGGSANERRLFSICECMVSKEHSVTELTKQRAREFLKQKMPTYLWSTPEARATIFPPYFSRSTATNP